jgi:hypothetical protein
MLWTTTGSEARHEERSRLTRYERARADPQPTRSYVVRRGRCDLTERRARSASVCDTACHTATTGFAKASSSDVPSAVGGLF